jgi:signal transduction histidine kinase
MYRIYDAGIAVGFALLAALIGVNAGLAYRNIRELKDNADHVAHTHEALDALGDLLSTVKDAETGQRGYLVTGVDRYLKPYDDAVAAVPGKIERVRRLTEDNKNQRERLPGLARLVRDKMAELGHSIALRDDPGFESARQVVMTDEGKEAIDALRAGIKDMQDEEYRLLRDRQEVSDRAYLVAVLSGMAGGVAGVAAAAAFFWTLRRHLAARARAAAIVREQREELRRQAEALKEAGRRKDQLRMMLAHELRNPLAAMRSTVQLWQRLPDVARTPASLDSMLATVDRLNVFAGRLLQFARTEDDRRPVDLNSVLNEALDLLQAQAAGRGVTLQRDFTRHLPPVVGSTAALHQLALNLLSNALQVMPHGGRLHCATRDDAQAGAVEFSVSDTGPGVPPELRPHLFQLFFTTRPEGTGLGLALCREIVTGHGGTITLDETSESGARFVVSLPATRCLKEESP